MFILTKEFQERNNVDIYEYNFQKNDFFKNIKNIIIPSLHFDSRKIDSRDFFIALKGNRDGHEFILDAYKKNITGFVINKSEQVKVFNEIKSINPQRNLTFILVDDTLKFLHNAAKYQREKFNGIVIAVLGSNGKTSTKDFLYQTIKEIEPNTYATTGNWNNHIGLPIILINMPENTKILILELGMNHPGEIEILSDIAKPNIALITSIGREHMEFFSNLEDVAKAELEILNHLDNGSTFYYPANAPLKDYVIEKSKEKGFKTIFFHLSFNNDDVSFNDSLNPFISYCIGKLNKNKIYWNEYIIYNDQLNHIGLYNNLFLTLIILHEHFFIQKEKNKFILKILSSLKPISKQRFEFKNINNRIIIDDSYNANPDSFINAIDSLKHLFSQYHKIGCIAGHMAELGHYSKEGHYIVGKYLAKNQIDLLAVCGQSDVLQILEGYKSILPKNDIPYFENSEILAKNLIKLNLPLKEYEVILIKGSRSAKMEIITQKLEEVLQNV